jgi:hypothetical protein
MIPPVGTMTFVRTTKGYLVIIIFVVGIGVVIVAAAVYPINTIML